jgi:hypothetical protein
MLLHKTGARADRYLPSAGWLLASQFSLVDVDSAYYLMPGGNNSVLRVERTPAGFVLISCLASCSR